MSQKFDRCNSEGNAYLQQKGGFLLLIFLYVNNFLVTSGSAAGLRDIKSSLSKAFSMTDLGSPRQFVGLEVNKKVSRIMITQSRYIGYFSQKIPNDGELIWAHLSLDAPICMSLGAPKENPYNLGTHTKFQKV